MGTAFDPTVHEIITDADDKPVPQKYDPEANSGAGGFVVINEEDIQYSQSTANIVVGAKTIGTTEVELYANASKLTNRYKITIFCEGNESIYIGDSGVSVSDGYPLPPGQTITFYLDPNGSVNLFAIANSNQKARIIEEAIS